MLELPKVELEEHNSLKVIDLAIGTCWDKHSDCGEINIERIDRVANKFKHESTIEHMSYTFFISNISRAVLQELARHRMSSPSVKSSRFTLKELKEEEPFIDEYNPVYNKTIDLGSKYRYDRATNYLIMTGDLDIDFASIQALENLRKLVSANKSNDKVKYCMPEAYKTEMTWTINARSLKNFLSLRSGKSALYEIRLLSLGLYKALPEDHKFLFRDCMHMDDTLTLKELNEIENKK